MRPVCCPAPAQQLPDRGGCCPAFSRHPPARIAGTAPPPIGAVRGYWTAPAVAAPGAAAGDRESHRPAVAAAAAARVLPREGGSCLGRTFETRPRQPGRSIHWATGWEPFTEAGTAGSSRARPPEHPVRAPLCSAFAARRRDAPVGRSDRNSENLQIGRNQVYVTPNFRLRAWQTWCLVPEVKWMRWMW